MVRMAHRVSRSAVLAACIIAALAATRLPADEESVTLYGEIEVVEQDDDGNATSVLIYDSEWGSVLISKEGKGKELLRHVGDVAEVTGTIVELGEDSDYSYAVRVTRYAIEESEEPDAGSGNLEAAASPQGRDTALAALGAAKSGLAGIDEQLGKVKIDLSDEYRALDRERSRGNHQEEAKSRAKIQELKGTRDDLWASRDRARLVVSQREAELESTDALDRVEQLRSSGVATPAELAQWQKKHERATARARRLQREAETLQRNAG